MSQTEKMYVDALAELEREAARFSDAMLRANGAAMMADPRGIKKDHPRAIQAFRVVREHLVGAFAKAPGMAQLFFPVEK